MDRARVILAGLGAGLVLAGCGAPKAPLFEAPDLKNASVSLETFHGRPVLLWFWATWSAPSRLALANLTKVQRAYGPQGVQVLAVAVDDDPQLVKRSFGGRTLGYPVLLGTTTITASYFPDGDMRVPTGLLLDGERRIVARYTGYQPVEAFQPALDRLTGSGAVPVAASGPAQGPTP